jgi:hypothetical protein
VLRVAIAIFCPREQSARSSDSNASPLSLAGLHIKRYPAAVSFDIRQESRYVSRPPDHAGAPSLDPFTPLGDVGVMLLTRDTQVQSPLAYGLHNTPGGEFEQTHIPRRFRVQHIVKRRGPQFTLMRLCQCLHKQTAQSRSAKRGR